MVTIEQYNISGVQELIAALLHHLSEIHGFRQDSEIDYHINRGLIQNWKNINTHIVNDPELKKYRNRSRKEEIEFFTNKAEEMILKMEEKILMDL